MHQGAGETAGDLAQTNNRYSAPNNSGGRALQLQALEGKRVPFSLRHKLDEVVNINVSKPDSEYTSF